MIDDPLNVQHATLLGSGSSRGRRRFAFGHDTESLDALGDTATSLCVAPPTSGMLSPLHVLCCGLLGLLEELVELRLGHVLVVKQRAENCDLCGERDIGSDVVHEVRFS